MERLVSYSGFVGAALMSIAFLSCGKEPQEPITSWNSPGMLTLKKNWDSLMDEFERTECDNDRDERWGFQNYKLYNMQVDILAKLTRDDMRHLAITCGVLPVCQRDPNAFEINALQHMAKVFIHDGDREGLVTLLSTRFPEYLDPEMPTGYCLTHFSAKGLNDPVLVLGEAYSRCKDASVRHDIAMTVRQGFEGFDISGKDDAEFVANAMQWYERNKSHLTPRGTLAKKNFNSFFEDDRETEK